MGVQKGNIPWNKGKITPEETRRKISVSNKGHSHPCWTKGLTKETDERVARMATTKRDKEYGPRPYRKGIRVSIGTEFKKGLIPEGGFETRFKKGADHPLWNGGVTSEHDKIRHGREYKQWRNSIYQRDHFHCQVCGKHCEKGEIIAHHINSFDVYEHLRFIFDNGITLCVNCHKQKHKKFKMAIKI